MTETQINKWNASLGLNGLNILGNINFLISKHKSNLWTVAVKMFMWLQFV